jgi:hypothetical protein
VNFLYYLPGVRHDVTWDKLPEPLRTTLAGAALECKVLAKGPDDAAGVLFTAIPTDPDGTQAPTTLYGAEKQIWEEHEGWWLGGMRDALPTPADLRRSGKPVEGHAIRMADGAEWIVPVVGPLFSRLPMVFRFKGGKPTEEVAERYRELAAESSGWAAWMGDADAPNRPYVDVMVFVARCLGLNYHVGLHEAGCLGIVDRHAADDALEAIVGLKDYWERDRAKKGE